jgi:hypothetical protein
MLIKKICYLNAKFIFVLYGNRDLCNFTPPKLDVVSVYLKGCFRNIGDHFTAKKLPTSLVY